MKWNRIFAVCMLMLAACQQQNQPSTTAPSETEVKQIDERVQGYFKKAANLPPGMTLKVMDVKPADVPGLLSASLEVSNGQNTQKVPLILSRDGRYLIQGQFTDLTVDPFKAVVDKISLKDAPVRGTANAPVTIVEYSDFQCPFCSRAYKTVEDQVMKSYPDQVRLVYKNFPLTNIHPWAESGALAAACARKLSPDAFWKMYDFLFQNQQDITLDNIKDKTSGVISGAGLDVNAYTQCFDNKSAMDLVKADEEEATAVGVRSTPTFFINGHKLEGAVPFDSFKSAIETALHPEGAPAAKAPAANPPAGNAAAPTPAGGVAPATPAAQG